MQDTDFTLSIQGNVYAFDTSVIDLCLSVFWWATFRKAKGAIKLHTLFDVKTSIPVFVHITAASVHDVNGLDLLSFEPGGYYVFDRGYTDFYRLNVVTERGALFVTRARDNIRFNRISSTQADKKKGILCDQTVELVGFVSYRSYPRKFRRIKFYDSEQNRILIFITNNFTLPATEIAMLYKYRWKVELFFKWIKQNLKIKSFWGTTINAVKIQVYTAIITYTLVAIIKSRLKLKQTTYEILQILSVSLLDKTALTQLFKNPLSQDVKEQNNIQLKISYI